jgi:hypothetical protein
MIKRQIVRLPLLVFAVLASLLVYGGQESTELPQAARILGASQDLFEITARTEQPGARWAVVLIGENHASVKTQQQLAEVLDRLYAANAIDAILVEGSNGKISTEDLAREFTGGSVKAFWRGRLDLGQIAGYEYVALTRRQPAVVFGVEDLKAKRDYTVGAAGRGVTTSLEKEVALHRRAFDLAERAFSQINETAGGNAKLEEAKSALAAYQQRINAFDAARQSDGAKYADLVAMNTGAVEDTTLIYHKIGPLLPLLSKLATEETSFEKLRAKAQAEVAGSNASQADLQQLLRQLQDRKTKIEQSEQQFEMAAEQQGYADAKAALDDLGSIKRNEDLLKTNERSLSELSERFENLESVLLDQFFLVANAVRSASGSPYPDLQMFLKNERDRARQEQRNGLDPEIPFLSDRDQHMADNTMAFVSGRENGNVRCVALIIGYAHLQGMTERLRNLGLNLVAGRLTAAQGDIEPWEERAWESRSRPAARVFSRQKTLKELSRLLDQGFKEETAALLKQLAQIKTEGTVGIPVGSARLYEVRSPTSGDKVILVGNNVADPRLHWGVQKVDSGFMPDGSGQSYVVFDRRVAEDEAKSLSTTKALFAVGYRTRSSGKLTARIHLPDGSLGLNEFMRTPPRIEGRVPERVVLTAEPDEGSMGRALVGGGDAGGKPPWTTVAGFAEDPEGSDPLLFLTINARRARAKVDALEKEQPLRFGDIAKIRLGFGTNEQSALTDLWFTPGQGDHARAFLIAGANTAEFRARIKDAADAGLFRNKQVALATCFDPIETEPLRELLLEEAGALMVWTPERRISPEAAEKLEGYMERADRTASGQRPQSMDILINRALALWREENQNDPDLKLLLDSSRWVRLFIVQPGLPS